MIEPPWPPDERQNKPHPPSKPPHLAVGEKARAFGVPFLSSFALGFVVLGGVCVGFLDTG